MTVPSLFFGFVLASLYGALFHLVRGGGPVQLFSYLALSWLGFALGHVIGIWRGWLLFPVGPLDFGTATLGSILLLALSLIDFRRLLKKKDTV